MRNYHESVRKTSFCEESKNTLALCFNQLLCCTRKATVVPIAEEPSAEEKENEDFWDGFYQAYSALTTPIIVGTIQKETLDVKISYANHAAATFTGYFQTKYPENPMGIIGRSVTDLMPEQHATQHSTYVRNWLQRRRDRSSSISSNELLNSSIIDRSRKVQVKKSDGSLVTVNATLSFFASRGRGRKVAGVFAFQSLPTIPIISLDGLKFNVLINPESTSNQQTISVTPPSILSQFNDDSLWCFEGKRGFIIDPELRDKCKSFIFNKINGKLIEVARDQELNICLSEKNGIAISAEKRQEIKELLIEAINTDTNPCDPEIEISFIEHLEEDENYPEQAKRHII